MTDRRDPYRSMLVLAGLIWVCAASAITAAVLMWITAFEKQRWAPAIISTVFALVVAGAAIHLAILMRRYKRQSQHHSDASSDDGK